MHQTIVIMNRTFLENSGLSMIKIFNLVHVCEAKEIGLGKRVNKINVTGGLQ